MSTMTAKEKRFANQPTKREKMALIFELRKKGYSINKIAQELEISTTYCNKLYNEALDAVVREPGEAYIKIEMERLDDLFIKAYEKATDPKMKLNRDAIDACLKIIDRRMALMGVNRMVGKPVDDKPSFDLEAAKQKLMQKLDAIMAADTALEVAAHVAAD